MSSTATAPKGKRIPRTFKALMSVAAKPISERPVLPIGRGGAEVVVRRHFMKGPKLRKLKDLYENGGPNGEGKGRIPNPHNSGSYRYILEALIELGPDQVHEFPAFKAMVKKLMGGMPQTTDRETLWSRFALKPMRNEKTGKDVNGRLQQNVRVLGRVGGKAANQYGYKLLQVGQEILGTKGMVIDILKVNNGKGDRLAYRLNTDSDTPLNEWTHKPKAEEVDAE